MNIKAILFLILWLSSSVIIAQDKLVFGVNPYQSPNNLQKLYSELIVYLEKSLHKEIVFLVSKDYDHLNTLIENGTVDIASISPKLLALLRQRVNNVHYLATMQIINEHGQKSSSYKGLIVTREDSSIRTLEDLKGKKFGFTDQSSTSGYLYPHLIMRQNGIDPLHDLSKVYMLKKHSKVLQALLERSIDAGAVYAGVYFDLPKEKQKMLRIIATTEEIPLDAILASPKLSKPMLDQIQHSLMQFSSSQTTQNAIVGFTQKPLALYDRLNTLE